MFGKRNDKESPSRKEHDLIDGLRPIDRIAWCGSPVREVAGARQLSHGASMPRIIQNERRARHTGIEACRTKRAAIEFSASGRL